MPPTLLRDATASDAEALTSLARRSKAYWGYDDAFMKACEAELNITAGRILSENILVAEVGGRIVGMVALVTDNESNVAELEDMFVDPDCIGTGLGGVLLSRIKSMGITLGVQSIEVDADPNAQGFYERCGYQLISTSPSASIPGRVLPRLSLDLS